MVQPPRRALPEEIPPREYVFVVDVSGSMEGFPLATARTLMRDLVGQLRPGDTFDVVTFAGTSRVWQGSPVPATRANVDAAIAFIDHLTAGGGTELLAALDRAMSLPPADNRHARSIVVITDGYIAAEAPLFGYIRENLGRSNVFAFGIGTAVNRHLIEGVAKAGLGEPFVVTDARQAAATAARFRTYIESPLLAHVRVAFEGFDAYEIEPKVIPDVLADRPVLVQGKWRGAPTGRIVLEGETGAGRYEQALDVAGVRPDESNRALRELWARTRVADLADWNPTGGEEHRQEIVDLGLTYSLLTRYTSFVAVHDVVRNPSGVADDVAQPSPLPAGVSDAAVGGGAMAMGDEPGLAWIVAVAALLAAFGMFWRKAGWMRSEG
jgi:Ca-activated chloride channel family protein